MPALVEPPSNSDTLEEWEFFYGLSKRMGFGLRLRPIRAEAGVLREEREPIDLDMERMPTSDELFEQMTRRAHVPLAEVKKHPHGAVFEVEPVRVAAREPGFGDRLEIGDETMLTELTEVRGEPLPAAASATSERFPFRLICRRLPNVYNSSGHDLPALTRRRAYNPAFMHPSDLDDLGLGQGDVVTISSDHGSILGIVEKAPDLRRGVVSMAHAFGDTPERDAELREIGSNTGRLISVERDFDPYTGIPRMSAIPVTVERFNKQ